MSLAENTARQTDQAPFGTWGPHFAENSGFLSFQCSSRWHGLLGYSQFPVHCLITFQWEVCGRTVCVAQILGFFKGFSKYFLSGQSAVKREMVVNEVEALCEWCNGLEGALSLDSHSVNFLYGLGKWLYFCAFADGRNHANGHTKPRNHKML